MTRPKTLSLKHTTLLSVHGFHLKAHAGLSAIVTIFSAAPCSECLCSALLKYFLFLSSVLPHSLICGEFHFFLSFSLFSPTPPPLLVLCPWPPPHPPSHRYLTPRSKTEFYDVTKWVEDVNRNTQGPFLRYYLSPCPVTHTLVDSSLHLLVWFLVRFRAILGIFCRKFSGSERCKKLACCSVGFSIKGDWPQHQTKRKKNLCFPCQRKLFFFLDHFLFICKSFIFCFIALTWKLNMKKRAFTACASIITTIQSFSLLIFLIPFFCSLSPLSLLLPLHVQCCPFSKCLCTRPCVAPPVLTCSGSDVGARPNVLGRCSDITAVLFVGQLSVRDQGL